MDDQSGTADAALPPVAVRTTALTLQADNVTADVVTAMREEGIRTLLLKVPSIAAWLCRDGAARPYTDFDLLVATGSRRQAGTSFGALGFRPIGYSPCWGAFAASGRARG